MSEYFAGGHLRFVDGEWRDDDGNMIEVSQVRHGRWVNEQMIVGGFAETWACDCSVCGRTHREPLWKPNYCPNCGAKMDLEDT